MNLPDVLNDDPAVRFGAGGMGGGMPDLSKLGDLSKMFRR